MLIDQPIADCPDNEWKQCIGSASNPGRSAQTLARAIQTGFFRDQPASKLLLVPASGRRHQLRVHLQSRGHPIVGDATYANDSDWPLGDARNPPRMYLHAYILKIHLGAQVGLKVLRAPDPFDGILQSVHDAPASIETLLGQQGFGLIEA